MSTPTATRPTVTLADAAGAYAAAVAGEAAALVSYVAATSGPAAAEAAARESLADALDTRDTAAARLVAMAAPGWPTVRTHPAGGA
jgi:hypothetical protein